VLYPEYRGFIVFFFTEFTRLIADILKTEERQDSEEFINKVHLEFPEVCELTFRVHFSSLHHSFRFQFLIVAHWYLNNFAGATANWE
jgi:hypothetical protein